MQQDDELQPIEADKISKAQKQMPSDVLLQVVVECFKALGDTTRAKILYLLRENPLCVRDLAILIGVSESGISHQLSDLKSKRLVKAERKGNIMYYSIAYQHLHALLKEAEYYADHVHGGILDHPYK